MEVQRVLREDGLERLVKELGIRVTHSPCREMVILNYDQLESPKRHKVVQECRALTLEQGTWEVVARSFPRFFNAGECPDVEKKFDWENFTAESKEDGSLMVLYRREGLWRVNTRGSFATGEITPGAGLTWEDVFYEAIDEPGMDDLPEGYSYVFELCSPYNRVVRRYDRPTLFLLSAFQLKTGSEMSDVLLDRYAEVLRVSRPTRYNVATLQQCVDFLNSHEDATFEGFVLRDRTGLRLKVKNKAYVALHHLKDNGNLFATKNLVPFILKGEQSEVLGHFPEAGAKVFDIVEKLYGQQGRMLAVWDAARGIKSQKEFALFVLKHTPLASLLFEARKRGVEPKALWNDAADLLLNKVLQGNDRPQCAIAA